MTDSVKAVHLSLLRLMGADRALGTGYSGSLVHFGAAIYGPTPLWRIVEFRGDQASTRVEQVPWADIEPLLPSLSDFCAHPMRVAAKFDTSDSWETIDLAVSLNGRPMQRLHLSLRSSGFEGDDAALLERLLRLVYRRAGLLA